MSTQTLEQKRAKHALAQIKPLQSKPYKDKYAAYVKALPAAILMNGLGQALATELAADDDAHHELANHLAGWLIEPELRIYTDPSSRDAKGLLDAIVAHGQDAYVRAQGEALAYLGWLKRFAAAFLDEKSNP